MTDVQEQPPVVDTQQLEERKDNLDQSREEEVWYEIRMQGKLPERRANHCAFVWTNNNSEYMYIHGGRDLNEGAVPSMWRVNLTALQQLHGGVQKPVCWEQVQTTGHDIGRISHHKCAMISAKQVAFFGGLRADQSSNCVSILNLMTNAWQNCNVKIQTLHSELPRDDFALADLQDGSFYCFGGYVGGTRQDEVLHCALNNSNTTNTIEVNQIAGGQIETHGPSCRAGFSVGSNGGKVYLFGGQEDDNKKLNDIWSFDCANNQWCQIEGADETYKPSPRSGHSTVVHGGKMWIFGGIYELTQELNDLVCFDFATQKFSSNSETAQPDDANNQQEPADKTENASPLKRKQTTVAGASMGRSPIKTSNSMHKPPKKHHDGKDDGADGNKGGISSPTFIKMQSSFIIKNADESFEVNAKQLQKQKHNKTLQTNDQPKYTSFMEGQRPTPRDGHTAVVDSQGFMYVFGGDRHHMPFNDLYMIKLE